LFAAILAILACLPEQSCKPPEPLKADEILNETFASGLCVRKVMEAYSLDDLIRSMPPSSDSGEGIKYSGSSGTLEWSEPFKGKAILFRASKTSYSQVGAVSSLTVALVEPTAAQKAVQNPRDALVFTRRGLSIGDTLARARKLYGKPLAETGASSRVSLAYRVGNCTFMIKANASDSRIVEMTITVGESSVMQGIPGSTGGVPQYPGM
jgi:hypothetical protein